MCQCFIPSDALGKGTVDFDHLNFSLNIEDSMRIMKNKTVRQQNEVCFCLYMLQEIRALVHHYMYSL